MQALRLAFGLFFSVIGLLGYLAFDFTMTNRAIVAGGSEPMGFFQYTKGWVGFAGMVAQDGEDAEALPGELVAMMPRAPEGWTVRPAADADAAPFVTADLRGEALDTVLSAVTPNIGRGVERAAQTYQSGARVVLVELVRYPDIIFTSLAGMANKFELQMATLETGGRGFMTVRGLEVIELPLPETVPARVFAADVGGQIHLRVLAPKTMGDEDLLTFFQTLHVPAMNADVVERVAGLGEVPVIVLASVIDDETRAAHAAERAAMAAEAETARAGAEAAEEMPGTAADAPAIAPAGAAESAPEDAGIKVRKGLGKDNQGSTIETGTDAGFGDNCRTESGRKVCSGTED